MSSDFAGRSTRRWQSLSDEPWQHDFFNFMRWVDTLDKDKPRLGTASRPADEALRLGQLPALGFAPASLHSVDRNVAGGRRPRVSVRFFGMFGPNGPLPLHLSEHAWQRLVQRGDATFSRFADMFHHRLLLLFYRAWAEAEPTVSLDRPGDDGFSRFVGSLIGLGQASVRRSEHATTQARLHFAGSMSRSVRSTEGLESMLAGYLGRPVRVEPFAGRWMALGTNAANRIGRVRRTAAGDAGRHARLGGGGVLGSRVWDRQHHICLHIEGLDRIAFESLLPGGAMLAPLKALVDSYVGHELGWDLRLAMTPSEQPTASLDRTARLGQTTWLGAHR